jgi:hypothetical protein
MLRKVGEESGIRDDLFGDHDPLFKIGNQSFSF